MLNCILDSCMFIWNCCEVRFCDQLTAILDKGDKIQKVFLWNLMHMSFSLTPVLSLTSHLIFCLVLFFSSKFKTCTLNLVWRSPNVTLTSKLQIVFLLLRYSSIPWTKFKESLAHFPQMATYFLFNAGYGYGAQCCSRLIWLSWLYYDHVACCTSKTRRHGSCC